MRTSWIALVLAVSVAAVAPAQANNGTVDVNVQPLGDPEIQEFDPSSPPAGIGKDGADAKTTVEFDGGGFNTGFDSGTGKFFTKDVDPVNLMGKTVIRIPKDASEKLKKHEQGHHTLGQDEYGRAANKIKDAMRGFEGQMFMGTGATFGDRAKDANKQAVKERDRRLEVARKAIDQQMTTINNKYDNLTDHSKSSTVDTDKGIKETRKERNRAPSAGEQSAVFDRARPFAGVATPTQLLYDQSQDLVSLDGNLVIDFAGDPTDPLIGRGRITVTPFVAIGLQENQTVHLSDTRFMIVDETNGDLLLNGYLFEAAYMPSSRPGFAGMIQGYLDVPPAFASEGVMNTIGSPFLDGIQSASAGSRDTMFRYFTDNQVFDAEGRVLLGQEGTTGQLMMGVVSPEPATIVLFSAGLLGIMGLRHRRR